MIRLLAITIFLLTVPGLRAVEALLPALRPDATIVFIGDSITDGGRARAGSDFNHTMGQDYAYILASQLGSRLAERNLTFVNRGIGGDRVLELQACWKTDS